MTRRTMSLRREALALGLGKNQREVAGVVAPFGKRGPAAGEQQQARAARTIFVAVLGVDARPLGKGEALAVYGEAGVANGDEVHFHPPVHVVPARLVAECS